MLQENAWHAALVRLQRSGAHVLNKHAVFQSASAKTHEGRWRTAMVVALARTHPASSTMVARTYTMVAYAALALAGGGGM